MAVAWVQTVTGWGALAAGPVSSASFTPTAGNYLVEALFNGAGSGQSRIYGGSANTPVELDFFSDTTNGNTLGIAGVGSIVGGAQTLSVNGSAMSGWGWEYSGVSTGTGNHNNPIGTTAPTGVATTVATGAILLAIACDTAGTSGAISAVANGGVTPTTRGSGTNGVNYCAAEYVGTGGSITPTFSATSSNFVVMQVLLASASAPTINTQPTNQTASPGQSVTFSVSATASAGSLTYQWYRNGASIGSATSSSYTFTPNYPADYGALWYCIVTDSNGSTQTNSVAVIWTVQTRFGPWTISLLDAGDQDYKSDLVIKRWF